MLLPEMASDGDITVLSNTRQKKSIGVVSKREKKTASAKKVTRTRTLVVRPGDIEWPLLKDDHNSILVQEVQNTMKILNMPIDKVSLREIRKVPKDERRDFRTKFRVEEATRLGFSLSNHIQLRSCLAIGVNCVSRSLQLNKLVAVLVDPDVNPPIITKLLIPVALNNSVPILAIKGLEEAVKSSANIRCIALGLKNCCKEESNYFHHLFKSVINLHYNEFVSIKSQSETPTTSFYKPPKIRKITS